MLGRTFAVLDIKNNEISAVAAHWGKNEEYIVEELINVPAQGISKGVVKDIDPAVDSIARAMQKLREKTGKRIHDICFNVSSPSVAMLPSSGTLLLSRYGREISQFDVEKCKSMAAIIKLPHEKESLHKLVKTYSIDGEEDISNPLGLEGLKLGVDMNVVALDMSVVRNLEKCVSFAGYALNGMVFSGIADSYRLLSGDKTEKDLALVNISRNLTEAAVFRRGTLVGCKVLPYGMDRILSADGHAKQDQLDRLKEALQALSGWDLVKEIVLAGDASFNENMIDIFEKMYALPVRPAVCQLRPFEKLPADCLRYVGCLGILDYLQEERRKARISKNPLKNIFRKILSFLDKYF